MKRITYTHCELCGSENLAKFIDLKDYSISQEDYEIWNCADCDFHFTQHVPNQEFIAPYYKSEDYISHSDTKKGIVNNLYHRVRQIMLDRKYKLVDFYSQGGTLLDYGSGTGYFPAYVKAKNKTVKAIEIDPDARKYSQDRFGLDVYEPEAMANGTFSSGEFDVISLWHVMEHLYNPGTYVQSFKNLLQENGHLIIAVPNFTSYDAEYYGKYWAAYDVPRHLWHFSPDTMKKMVEKEGFILVDKKPMPFDSFYVSLLSEKYKNGKSLLMGGFLRGFRSYSKAAKNVDKCSSVIYVFRKS